MHQQQKLVVIKLNQIHLNSAQKATDLAPKVAPRSQQEHY